MTATRPSERRGPPRHRGELLTIDDLEIDVRWSDRRRTVELLVERDGGVAVRAPRRLRRSTIERFVRDRRGWLDRKLAELRSREGLRPRRCFEAGEVYWYLGGAYRLELVDEQAAALRLRRGRFLLRRSDRAAGRTHFVDWYIGHAGPWFERRVDHWAPTLGAVPSRLIVRDLGRRWGSCTSASGRVRLHWAIIQMPRPIADYVLVHELVHLLTPDHSRRFWSAVERLLPDYRERKAWLAANGDRYCF